MASRKEQKEQARAARVAAEQAARERAARMRRMQLLGGTVLVAIAAIVVIVAISVGGSSPSNSTNGAAKTSKQERALYAQVNALLGGIPESGQTLGNPNAPVSVTYYGDLECPYCQIFTLDALPEFITKDVRTGKAKVTYKSFCTATCHLSNGQQIFNSQEVAAYSAGMQKLFWYYADLFYHQQGTEGSGYVTPTFLQRLANEIPQLNKSKWQTDRQDPSLLAQVQADGQAGNNTGVTGTPTVIFKGPKGEEIAPNSIIGPGGYSAMASTLKAVS